MLVELYTNAAANCPQNGCLEYLHDPYTPEVSVPPFKEDDHLTGALHWKDAVPEGCLDEVNYPVPVTCVQVLLYC